MTNMLTLYLLEDKNDKKHNLSAKVGIHLKAQTLSNINIIYHPPYIFVILK